jgi:hypothetical protein
LPEKYRTVLVLCELEGKTGREAARQLGLPQGTVASRLARARALLARRLGRHGVAVSGGVLAAVLAQHTAAAGVPPAVLSSTIKAVTAVAAGQAAAGVVALHVAALTEGVLKAMLLTKLKGVMLVLLVAVAVVGSGGVLYRTQAAGPGEPGLPPVTPRAVAAQDAPAAGEPGEDKHQASKEPKGKAEGDTPKENTARNNADESVKPSKPTADRVKLVRQMYAKLPCEIIGFAEPAKRIVSWQNDGRARMVTLEDANGKKLAIYLVPKLGDTTNVLLLTAGRLPPRGPEESAVYGLLLRLSTKPPDKTVKEGIEFVDAILAALDERFAGAMPIAAQGAEK